jgi:hypothetical protein
MTMSVNFSIWGWICQKLNSVNRALKALEAGDIHSQVSDDHAILQDTTSSRHMADGLKCNIGDAALNPKIGSTIEINEWRVRAGDSGYFTGFTGDSFDWRLVCGLVSHDGTLIFWDTKKQCWLPLSESIRFG